MTEIKFKTPGGSRTNRSMDIEAIKPGLRLTQPALARRNPELDVLFIPFEDLGTVILELQRELLKYKMGKE